MRNVSCTLLILALAGCAQTHQPIIDQRQIADPARYQFDLAECRQYAEQVSPAASAAKSGAVGAAVGAVLGLAVGAIGGNAGQGAAIGAITGGGSGAVGGALAGGRDQETVIANCLRGRGYAVLR